MTRTDQELDAEIVKRLKRYKAGGASRGSLVQRFKETDVVIEQALIRLRAAGLVTCTNGTWWAR